MIAGLHHAAPRIRLAGRVRTPFGLGTVRWVIGLHDGQTRYRVQLDEQGDHLFRREDLEDAEFSFGAARPPMLRLVSGGAR